MFTRYYLKWNFITELSMSNPDKFYCNLYLVNTDLKELIQELHYLLFFSILKDPVQ